MEHLDDVIRTAAEQASHHIFSNKKQKGWKKWPTPVKSISFAIYFLINKNFFGFFLLHS